MWNGDWVGAWDGDQSEGGRGASGAGEGGGHQPEGGRAAAAHGCGRLLLVLGSVEHLLEAEALRRLRSGWEAKGAHAGSKEQRQRVWRANLGLGFGFEFGFEFGLGVTSTPAEAAYCVSWSLRLSGARRGS
eukprot:4730681-Prymnesium_polylepis.1